MITYKLYTDTSPLDSLNREFMSAVRASYGVWQKNPNHSLSQVEAEIKKRNLPQLDASLIKMAVNQAKNLREKSGVVFGSAKLFEDLKWHKGDLVHKREQYRATRQTGMLLRGSKADPCGNRKAQLDILNNQVLIKPKKGKVIALPLRLTAQRHNDLSRQQAQCEVGDAYFNVQINHGYVCISFDEQTLSRGRGYRPISHRIMSIDSNPNYLGVVIADDNQVIHKEIIDFKDLNYKSVANNKRRHEKYQAVKHLIELAAHYRCESIAVEKLTMPGADHNKGRTFNRLVNNTWHKNLMHNSLAKWCKIRGIKFIPVIAAYSSFVGCLENPTEFDSIAAALELNRRARLAMKHQKYNLLPTSFDSESIPTLWKEMGLAVLLANGLTSWRQLYQWCRDMKFSYRIPYKRDLYNVRCRSLCSPMSRVQVVHMRPDQEFNSCICA